MSDPEVLKEGKGGVVSVFVARVVSAVRATRRLFFSRVGGWVGVVGCAVWSVSVLRRGRREGIGPGGALGPFFCSGERPGDHVGHEREGCGGCVCFSFFFFLFSLCCSLQGGEHRFFFDVW